jgi:hypothetical protein
MEFKGTVPPLLEHQKSLIERTIKVVATRDLDVIATTNGHWKFPEPMGERKGITGFVYVIRDPYLQRFYMGKKFYKGAGKLNKGMVSNWKSYMSSSATLAQMLEHRPKSEFEFICLEEYKMRGAVSYAETWGLCHVEAPTTKNWYNTRIEEISWNVSEGITERHKERLARVIAFDKFEE